MIKQLLLSAAFVSTLSALPAQAVDCWGKSTPGAIVDCLAGNSFGGDVNRAGVFYGQNNAIYKKPPLPVLNLTSLLYEESPPGSGNFALKGRDGQGIGTLKGGALQVSLPAPLVAAGGGNFIGPDGGTMVAVGPNMANAVIKQTDKNPSVAPMNGRALLGLNDLRGLKARSVKR